MNPTTGDRVADLAEGTHRASTSRRCAANEAADRHGRKRVSIGGRAGCHASRAACCAALLVGAGVAVVLGVYGRVHDANSRGLPAFGFSQPTRVQGLVRLRRHAAGDRPTGAGFLALRPAAGSRRGTRLGGDRPSGHRLHRLRAVAPGRGVVSLRIRVQPANRSLAASCCTRSRAACCTARSPPRSSSSAAPACPSWAIPLVGSILFTVIVLVWLSSAVWYVLYHE